MKKYCIFAFGISVLLAACSSDMDYLDNEMAINSDGNISYCRSVSEAELAAMEGIRMLEGDDVKTRAEAGTIKRRTLSVPIIKTQPSTRSSIDIDTLMYIFNFEEGNGYVLVDANKSRPALIAVTGSGSYVDDDTTDDWPVKTIQSLVNGYLHSINDNKGKDDGEIPSREEINEWSDTTITTINPRITVQWGQLYPFNIYTSPYPAGCGVTAMLQVMSYFKYPAGTFALDYPNADVSSINLDWNTFNHHIRYGSYFSHYDDSIVSYSKHQDMGRLARQLVKDANAVFIEIDNIHSTGTTFSDIRTCLINMGYTCPYIGNYFSTSHLFNSLSLGFLILMDGEESDNSEGHIWIVDGGIHYEIVTTLYGYNHTTNFFHIISRRTAHRYYNHVNWGWDGAHNGYFLEGIFDTSNFTWTDGISNPQNCNFNTSLRTMAVYL